MGTSLYCLCVLSGFGGRAGFDVNTSHACLQAVLAVITLVAGGSGEGGAETITFFIGKDPDARKDLKVGGEGEDKG